MCGVCGFVDGRNRMTQSKAREIVAYMADTLASRGPDGAGAWVEDEARVAFGHRRLAIIDLSPAGHQPMVSEDGNLVITFNGEIYNYRELRSELEKVGHRFRGDSDTEVLLEACRAWGVHATTRRLNGIFAFALWDSSKQVLTLVRDHLGIKPLYWAQFRDFLVFGSQLKALRAFPAWTPEIDLDALAAFHQLGYIPAPWTIYRGVEKLLPGSVLTWSPGTCPRQTRFWDLTTVAHEGQASQTTLDMEEAASQLEDLLQDAVRSQLVSDVPIGAFLSGGIDSSTVVALMQMQSSTRVKTFSIGFREERFNEAEYARAVATHLGTDHTEFYIEPRHALEIIPRLPEWFDEPFADPSQIPTYLLSELTRREVTVALSGDGGDELFAGYKRYFQATSIHRATGWMPARVRHLWASALEVGPPAAWDRLMALLPLTSRLDEFGLKVHKFADLLRCDSPDEILRLLITHCTDTVVLNANRPHSFTEVTTTDCLPDALSRMQLFESTVCLPEDMLAKVDRASMAVGLEVRVPLLDPRIVDFSWHLPASFKVHRGQGKWLLRKVLYRHVPPRLVERPKMGFGVPIGAWLRGPLREWAEDLLSEQRLREDGMLDSALVRQRWDEHQTRKRNWQFLLWDVLMFQAWYRQWHCGLASHSRAVLANCV
jgi:asparagine synthase (glutamine-hydrolysing)